MSARGILGRPWGEIPLPLRAFAVVSLLRLPWLVVVSWGHAGLVVFMVAFFALVAVLLLRGSRVVWVFLVGAEVVSLLLAPWTGLGPWWGVLLGLGETALLVWPSSFRFVWRERRPKPAARTATEEPSWEVGVIAADADRSDGWYIDPEEPRWMRYWHGETGTWQGRERTPRRLRVGLPQAAVAAAPAPDVPQTTWDPHAQPDADRPRGWYVDPGSPDRMRFWGGGEAGWQGRAKTPPQDPRGVGRPGLAHADFGGGERKWMMLTLV